LLIYWCCWSTVFLFHSLSQNKWRSQVEAKCVLNLVRLEFCCFSLFLFYWKLAAFYRFLQLYVLCSFVLVASYKLFWFTVLNKWLDVLICACFNGLLKSFGMVFGELGNSLDWKKMGFLGWIRLCVGIDSCLELLLFFFFYKRRRDRGCFFSKVWIFFNLYLSLIELIMG